ncbi:MAG TPA: hypothetical protein VHN37_07390 [Actinomycetota bacterium]|nr:hypothetical protein [Actinomycetota bacterium]
MARTREGRRGRGAIAVLSVVALAVCAGPTMPARGAPCPGVTSDGAWKTITTPVPAAAFTVDSGGRIYAGGDGTILTSTNGGCTWRSVLRLDGTGLPPQARVTRLATTGDSVLAAVTGPYVLTSADRGATWTESRAGLDVPGEPVGLYAAPSGAAAYLVVRQELDDGALEGAGLGGPGLGATATALYRSMDGGATWTRRGSIGGSVTGPRASGAGAATEPASIWDLAIDPADPAHLLAATSGGLLRSTDAGATWAEAISDPGARTRAVDMWRGAGGSTAAIAVDPSDGTVYETSEGGGAWTERSYPQLRTELMSQYPNAAAWAWTAAGAQVFVSGPKGMFRLTGSTLVDVTPETLGGPGETAVDLQIVRGAPWARLLDGSALVTSASRSAPGSSNDLGRDGSGPVRVPSPPRTIDGIPRPPVAGGLPEVEAERAVVEVSPGESETVAVEARLGPHPVSVDLFFLVDTTSSMSDTIRGLVGGMEEIAVRLARSGIRLRAGLGAFRTYPREADRPAIDYAYRRLRALGTLDASFVRALYRLEGGGSSGANLTALYQAVTGAGQDVTPPGPSQADVAAGRGAGFRDRALKVVMHFADTWFGTPERGDPSGYYAPGTWPGPAMETVADVLRGNGVLHLGVALQPGAGGTVLADGDVVEDMRALSLATSSLAGARGADCDDDGRPDVGPGEPLVCLLDRDRAAGGVASAVTGLVDALERRGDVELVEESASGLVRAIAPARHPGVDLRARQRLGFEVTVACAARDAGTRRSIGLGLRVAGDAVARTSFDVVCADLPVDARLPRSERTPSLVPPLLPIPAPPPPHPVPGPGPGSVTAPAPVQAPAPAQAPGGQPHAATVAQRQQQPQPAFVVAAQQVRAQTRMQYALVRTKARDPLAAARMWTAVGGLSVVWAWGVMTAAAASRRAARVPR